MQKKSPACVGVDMTNQEFLLVSKIIDCYSKAIGLAWAHNQDETCEVLKEANSAIKALKELQPNQRIDS